MRIQPTQQTFGLRTQRSIRYDSPQAKRIIDTAFLQNGKKVGAAKQLKDYLGNILNGKAEQYSDGKKTKTVYIV